MMNLPEMRRLYRVKRFDFWVAVAAILGTLAFGVLAGVIIGIGLSLLWLIAVATQPDIPTLAREPGTQVYRDLIENPDDERPTGVAVVRLDGGLFFATADALEDRVRALVQETPGLTGVVIDLEGVNFIDSQGSARLDDILILCDQAEVTLRLARVKPRVRAVLEREHLVERLGSDHIHGNVHRAVEAQKAEAAAVREARRRRSP
jgi:SulP family sulfate permease